MLLEPIKILGDFVWFQRIYLFIPSTKATSSGEEEM